MMRDAMTLRKFLLSFRSLRVTIGVAGSGCWLAVACFITEIFDSVNLNSEPLLFKAEAKAEPMADEERGTLPSICARISSMFGSGT